jgi:hypothetical protein
MTSREHARRLLLILLATDEGPDRMGVRTARPVVGDTDVRMGTGAEDPRHFVSPPSLRGAD